MKELIAGLVELLKAPYGMGFIIVLVILIAPWWTCGQAIRYFADTQAAALKQLHDDIITVVRCASEGRLNAAVPNR